MRSPGPMQSAAILGSLGSLGFVGLIGLIGLIGLVGLAGLAGLGCNSGGAKQAATAGSSIAPRAPVPLDAPPVPLDATPAPAPPKPPSPDALPAQPQLSPADQARIPAGGILIATRTDRDHASAPPLDLPDVFLIDRLTRQGLVEVYREEATQAVAFGWLDHKTLVVYSEDVAHVASLRRFVDGTPSAPVAIPLDAWQLADAPERSATMAITSTGEAWLARCTRHADAHDIWSKCLETVALRVDAGPPFAHATKLPANVLAGRVSQDTEEGGHLVRAELPHVAPPPNHTLAMFKVTGPKRKNFMSSYDRGWRCGSPAGNSEWPYGSDWVERQNIPTFRPTAVTWVSTTPPRYVVEGTATNMVAHTATWTVLFRACANDPLDDAAFLGDGLWAETDGNKAALYADSGTYAHVEWRLFLDDRLVGVLVGSQIWFAPQPR
jgi:hypothetical protein